MVKFMSHPIQKISTNGKEWQYIALLWCASVFVTSSVEEVANQVKHVDFPDYDL